MNLFFAIGIISYFEFKLKRSPRGLTEDNLADWILDQIKTDLSSLDSSPEEISSVTRSQNSLEVTDADLPVSDHAQTCHSQDGEKEDASITFTFYQSIERLAS